MFLLITRVQNFSYNKSLYVIRFFTMHEHTELTYKISCEWIAYAVAVVQDVLWCMFIFPTCWSVYNVNFFLISDSVFSKYVYILFVFVLEFIHLPRDYNNYKKVPKKCKKKWRGGLKETIDFNMSIRSPQLQFFEDGTKITATDTDNIRWKIKLINITEVYK